MPLPSLCDEEAGARESEFTPSLLGLAFADAVPDKAKNAAEAARCLEAGDAASGPRNHAVIGSFNSSVFLYFPNASLRFFLAAFF
jgi:hypothetical protein